MQGFGHVFVGHALHHQLHDVLLFWGEAVFALAPCIELLQLECVLPRLLYGGL